ncbi:MAG TPA: lysophospholipid acyltransferase family protein [Euzebyales bacterium]|nr:lysophospholipid acyltransferase family protein [Euzebyales bacterium]
MNAVGMSDERKRRAWIGSALFVGRLRRFGRLMRVLMRWLVWKPIRLVFCRPLHVEHLARLPREPVVFVANHASHADTVVLLEVLGRRRMLAVAAADDYWFKDRVRGLALAASLGAFPFPREGTRGLRRTEELLAAGWSVLIYPQGTRGGGKFRSGIGRLAAAGAVLVPIGVVGTRHVLPKGASWPQRHAVSVRIGEALRVRDAHEAVRRAERAVAELSHDPELGAA